ncbi:hypothetical protein D3C86_1626850 [compost metagenome]
MLPFGTLPLLPFFWIWSRACCIFPFSCCCICSSCFMLCFLLPLPPPLLFFIMFCSWSRASFSISDRLLIEVMVYCWFRFAAAVFRSPRFSRLLSMLKLIFCTSSFTAVSICGTRLLNENRLSAIVFMLSFMPRCCCTLAVY